MLFNQFKYIEGQPLYRQIEQYIQELIDSGILINGGKLPSTREMAKSLGISRNVIMNAYEELEMKGLLYTVKGKGTFVCKKGHKEQTQWHIEWQERKNQYSHVAEEMDIVKTELPWEKHLISFKSISPDGSLFDLEEVKKAFLNRLAIEGDKILNYGYAKGYKPLIDYLNAYMESKGIYMKNKEIIITNGFTEGLELLLAAYTKPGDKILCENPTHHTALKMMKAYELEVIGLPWKKMG